MTFDPNKQPIYASTQDHLDIVDIVSDLVLLKGNRVALVIQTNAVNFDLLSEEEQDARIMAFAGLLNSLEYAIQVVIRTRKVNISGYLSYLNTFLKKSVNQAQHEALQTYLSFIKKLIVRNEILDKKFYIVITYIAGVAKPSNLLPGNKSNNVTQIANDLLIEQAKMNLYPKRDHIQRQLLNMGLVGVQLKTNQLKKLFYDMYN